MTEQNEKQQEQLSEDQILAQNYLEKRLRVIIKDEREFFGTLVGFDKDCNLILGNACECIPMKYVTPINQNLFIHFRDRFKGEDYINLPQDVLEDEKKLEEFNKEFRKNKFLIGQTIIPGHQIKQILQQQ